VTDQPQFEVSPSDPDAPWTRRRALTILYAAWAAPALITLATFLVIHLALGALTDIWPVVTARGTQFVVVVAAISTIHGAVAFGLLHRVGARLPNPDIRSEEIAPSQVRALGYSLPYAASLPIAFVMGDAYLYSVPAALVWTLLYRDLTNGYLGPILQARAPALWPSDPKVVAKQRSRSQNRALQVLAALYLLLPFLAAFAVIAALIAGR